MPVVTVALLQMASCGANPSAALEKGDLFCRQARALGAGLALFPEMWNVGYTFFDPADPEAQARWGAMASGPEDAYYRHFQALAYKLEMAIALTYLERWPEAPRNTLTLFDRRGDKVFSYAKVHTCRFDFEAGLTPGMAFLTAPLDTQAGAVQVGAMICFDREFPESARVLMLKGAEIILVPNACIMERHRLEQLSARAFENMAGIALANYAAPNHNGHSVAFDGMAFDSDGEPRDMRLVEAGEEEGIYLARFDLDQLRVYRQHEVWGNAFRRPDCYHDLVSPRIDSPFKRA